MGLDTKFDLKPYLEIGVSVSWVRLWKVQFGDPISGNPPKHHIHVLAINIDHAIAIARTWDDYMCRGMPEEKFDDIYSVEAVDCTIVSDPQFIIDETGRIKHPDDK